LLDLCHLLKQSAVTCVWLQAVSTALKGIEARYQADKQMAEQRQLADRNRAAQAAKAAESAAAALRCRIAQLQASLGLMAAEAWALRQGTRAACTPGSDAEPVVDQGSAGSNFRQGSSNGSKPRGISLSDAGAGGGFGSAGKRWLYLHQDAGPWAAARQAMQDALAQADRQAAGGVSSINGEPHGFKHMYAAVWPAT
jgi:hypothetical protein